MTRVLRTMTPELIVQLAQAGAWPVVTLLIVLILRKPIRELLTTRPLSRLKAGPLEVEWDRLSSEVAAEIEPTPPATQPGDLSDQLSEEVDIDPTAAVLAAHVQVDRTLRELLVGANVSTEEVRRAGSTVGIARLARRHELISEQSLQAVEGVTVMRNLTAHGKQRVTREQAADYLLLVDALLYALRTGTPPSDGASSAGAA